MNPSNKIMIEGPSEQETNEIYDIYKMFKCDSNQNILAENLLLVLQSISGLRDIHKEISNEIDNR